MQMATCWELVKYCQQLHNYDGTMVAVGYSPTPFLTCSISSTSPNPPVVIPQTCKVIMQLIWSFNEFFCPLLSLSKPVYLFTYYVWYAMCDCQNLSVLLSCGIVCTFCNSSWLTAMCYHIPQWHLTHNRVLYQCNTWWCVILDWHMIYNQKL